MTNQNLQNNRKRGGSPRSSGFVLTLIVLLVVFGRWGWVSFKKFEIHRMADELIIPGNFWGAPMANQANTAFIFGERSENGINVYLHRDNQKTNIVIGAFTVGQFNALTLRLLAWSPDDKWCAYTRDGGVFIYDGESGAQVAALNVGGSVENFAWLSPSKFAAFNGTALDEFDYQPAGWAKKRVVNVTNTQPVTAFSALTDHSVVWRQTWDIWIYDFYSDQPVKIWHSMKNPLVDFTVEKSGDILLNCGRSGGSLIDLNPFQVERDSEPGSGWAETRKLDDLDTNHCFVLKVTALKNRQGRVYLTTDSWERDMSHFSSAKDKTLWVKKDPQSIAVQILGHHEIVDYSLQGDRIYIVGSETNEPPRIWAYDLTSDSLACVYSSIPKPRYAKLVQASYCVIANEQGATTTTYRLWPPVQVVPGKKYPLMIEQTAYKWQPEPQVAANCGWYFAMASRPSWGAGMQNWGKDVMAVYHELAKNPNIDTNRVFLYGVSAEAYHANGLLAEDLGLWKGAFLDGAPGPDPTLFKSHPLTVGIVVGNQDSELKVVSDYLERACQHSQSTTVVLKEGGHSWLSAASLRVSARSLADFLTENE